MAYVPSHLQYWFCRSALSLACYTLVLWIAGCGKATDRSPLDAQVAPTEYVQDLGPITRISATEHFQIIITAENLGFRGRGNTARAVLSKVTVEVAEIYGDMHIQLSAADGIALHPYEEISLHGISIQSADATTFEGEELAWPYADRTDRVGLLGPALLVTNDLMVEGDTIVGDLLMGAYEILHVVSYIDLQAVPEDSTNTNAGH